MPLCSNDALSCPVDSNLLLDGSNTVPAITWFPLSIGIFWLLSYKYSGRIRRLNRTTPSTLYPPPSAYHLFCSYQK